MGIPCYRRHWEIWMFSCCVFKQLVCLNGFAAENNYTDGSILGFLETSLHSLCSRHYNQYNPVKCSHWQSVSLSSSDRFSQSEFTMLPQDTWKVYHRSQNLLFDFVHFFSLLVRVNIFRIRIEHSSQLRLQRVSSWAVNKVCVSRDLHWTHCSVLVKSQSKGNILRTKRAGNIVLCLWVSICTL